MTSMWKIVERTATAASLVAALLLIRILLLALTAESGNGSPAALEIVERPTGLSVAVPKALLPSRDTKVVVMEFSDYECPFCRRHARETYPLIEKEFVTLQQVAYIRRHLPLTAIHPNAFRAAKAAECARTQGRFEEMHARLLTSQETFDDAQLRGHAAALDMNQSAFADCIAQDRVPRLLEDMQDAHRLKVQSTPTFLIGHFDAERGLLKVVVRLNGAAPFEMFKAELESALNRKAV